jgi:hypothetical protein
MATNFPTSLDTFTNPNSGNTLDSPSHSIQHSDINDAVEAIEAKIGVGSSTAGSATAGYALVNTSGGTTAYSLLGVSGLSSGTAVANTVLTANGSGGATFAPSAGGLTLLIPASVSVGSGTGTVSATGTVTFSGASSVSINTVFSSTYENYLLLINLTTNSANDGDVYFRLRSVTTDATTAYYWGRRGWTIAGAGTDGNGNNASAFTVMTQDASVTGYSHTQLNVFSPFLSQKTKVGWLGSATTDAGGVYGQFGGGVLDDSTSYNGFSIVNQNGTSTGKLSVYGYNF